MQYMELPLPDCATTEFQSDHYSRYVPETAVHRYPEYKPQGGYTARDCHFSKPAYHNRDSHVVQFEHDGAKYNVSLGTLRAAVERGVKAGEITRLYVGLATE